MSIQISLVLWTVICFALLYVILKFLLLKPLEQVTKSRQEKVEAAKKHAEEAEKSAEQSRLAARRRAEEQTLAMKEALKAEIEETIAQGKIQLEEARKNRLETVAQYRASAEAATAADSIAAKEQMPGIADAFLNTLFAEG